MSCDRHFTIVIGVCGVALVVLLLGYALSSPSGGSRSMKAEARDARSAIAASQKSGASTDSHTEVLKSKRYRPRIEVDEFDGLSGLDRKLAEAVQAAMDADDHRKIIKAAVAALASTNAAVRVDAVDALGWCGKDSLAELTGLLADPDEDVRGRAINSWECALTELDNPKLRYSAALAVMGTITEVDALDSISGQFGNAAQEYIDEVEDEDAQNERRAEIVQQLYDIIEGENSICSEKAKEAYNDLTGHEWVSAEEADKYLASPDEYEPPEDADGKSE